MPKKMVEYFGKHPLYNAIFHVIGGIGIGILITYPLIGNHPIRWGVLFLVVGAIGAVYPLFRKG